MNLVAWLAAAWLLATGVLLGLFLWHPAVRFHWSTVAYFGSTIVFSMIAFVAMMLDKYRAGTGGRRIPEAVLHTFELLGGWPGSLLAQRTIRHKNRKMTYQFMFWSIAALHLALLLWMAFMWWNAPAASGNSTPRQVTEPAAD